MNVTVPIASGPEGLKRLQPTGPIATRAPNSKVTRTDFLVMFAGLLTVAFLAAMVCGFGDDHATILRDSPVIMPLTGWRFAVGSTPTGRRGKPQRGKESPSSRGRRRAEPFASTSRWSS